MYAQPDDSTDSARLTFVSPTGNKLKSLKEVKKFLEDTANAPRIPVKGGLIEAEMEDEHEKRLEWVQGTITKVLPRNGGFAVSFKVENAEEKGTWEETYKVGQLLRLSTVSLLTLHSSMYAGTHVFCAHPKFQVYIPFCSSMLTTWRHYALMEPDVGGRDRVAMAATLD